MTTAKTEGSTKRFLLSKVPEVTLWFWIIKVLCTTVGESAADFLNVNLNLGLTGTSVITGVLLVVVLVLQFTANRYIPVRYWTAVAVVSVFGTLVTDNLTDHLGIPLTTSTMLFAALLGVTFLAWYAVEKTLSIHSIFTTRREAFYWLAVLFSFALGTAAGDLLAEDLGLGYLVTGTIVASLIAITAIAWKLGLNSILSFWIIYILTRPLGASIGDYLSQPSRYGGLGLGAAVTSAIFFVGIIGVVTYLTITKADSISNGSSGDDEAAQRGGLLQTVIVLVLVISVGGVAYHMRRNSLQNEGGDTATAAAESGAAGDGQPATSTLGDLSSFKVITQDTLNDVSAGDQSAASSRVDDLEHEWDTAQARLKAKDKAQWTVVDGKIDTVLRQVRSVNPESTGEQTALTELLAALG
jgi:uncharacterized membrane-anchored protein